MAKIIISKNVQALNKQAQLQWMKDKAKNLAIPAAVGLASLVGGQAKAQDAAKSVPDKGPVVTNVQNNQVNDNVSKISLDDKKELQRVKSFKISPYDLFKDMNVLLQGTSGQKHMVKIVQINTTKNGKGISTIQILATPYILKDGKMQLAGKLILDSHGQMKRAPRVDTFMADQLSNIIPSSGSSQEFFQIQEQINAKSQIDKAKAMSANQVLKAKESKEKPSNKMTPQFKKKLQEKKKNQQKQNELRRKSKSSI